MNGHSIMYWLREAIRQGHSLSLAEDSVLQVKDSAGNVLLAINEDGGIVDLTISDDLAVTGDVDIDGGLDVDGTSTLDSTQIDGQFLLKDVASIAGAGTNQATATPLTNTVAFVTGADGTVGVILPALSTALLGTVRIVYNSVATNGLLIYPNVGDAINGGSDNAAITIEGKTLAILVAVDLTTWAAIFTANT